MDTSSSVRSIPKVRLGIFGIGMHFQETYSMAFKRPELRELADIIWVVDLAEKQALALARCAEAKQKPQFIGVSKFRGTSLPKNIRASLDKMQQRNPVDAVIVSTTPEQHRAYAEWAISKGVPVIIDKPISARSNAMWDESEASGILEDWQSITDKARQKNLFVVVNSHRRFHPAYMKVSELLSEVSEITGTGVTALSSFNSDGQWRLPQELLDIKYHGYENGNGVLSHFGYHYLDLAMLWYMKGTPAPRRANKMRVSSSLSSAVNYSQQISTTDAAKALKMAGQPKPHNRDSVVREAIKKFGEVDAFCSVEMMTDDHLAAHITLQLLHSGFSQRAWTQPATNLYKENGRVRWENHLIQQGPFQSIEIRSFQAVQPNWKKPDEGIPRWELGGSDHLEINVYRNSLLGKPILETINCKDLIKNPPKDDVIHEDTKANVLLLFIAGVAIKKKLPAEKHIPLRIKAQVQKLLQDSAYDLSLIHTHQATVALMAACYESYARKVNNPAGNERIEKEILWQN